VLSGRALRPIASWNSRRSTSRCRSSSAEDIYLWLRTPEAVWQTALGVEIATRQAASRFRSAQSLRQDKPDTRFGWSWPFHGRIRASNFKVFSGAIAAGGVVKALNAKGLAGADAGPDETMTEHAKSFGAKGLAFIKVEGGEWKSPIVKFFNGRRRPR